MIVTIILLATTCVVSIVAFRNQKAGLELVMWPPAVTRRHQYHRLLTYGFVHADASHLIFNMVTLFFFGRLAESLLFAPIIGSTGFLIFYLGALVASILPSYLRHRTDAQYVSLGASGAVSAVLFAWILIRPWAPIYFFLLPIPIPAIIYAVLYVGYSIYMDRRGGDHVNHSAHLWGGAYGIVFSIAMAPGLLPHFLAALAHPHFGSG